MNLVNVIKQETDELFSEVVGHYHFFASASRASYKKNTSKYITSFLDAEDVSLSKILGVCIKVKAGF